MRETPIWFSDVYIRCRENDDVHNISRRQIVRIDDR
jgi:hypothetical protein